MMMMMMMMRQYCNSFHSNVESLTSHSYVHSTKLLRTDVHMKNRLVRQTLTTYIYYSI